MGKLISYSTPIFIHLGIVLPLTYVHNLNLLEFLGLNFSLGLTLRFLLAVGQVIYNTWLGVLLGHNVDLKKMGSWAIVTGATDGIGWAYCKELAKRKINVVLMSRTLEKLEKCAVILRKDYGIQTKVIAVDFSGDVNIYDNVDLLLHGMDIGTLINNVGMTYSRPTQFHDLPDSKRFIHDMINLNALAVTMMTRSVLPGMLQRGRGVVVNVGSYVSCNRAPWYALYGASKAFMDKFTDDLATEYKDTGIIFQYQLPGYVCTKMSKIQKPTLGTPTAEQYANAGINSIGLQSRTAVWIPHRVFVGGLSIVDMVMPKYFDEFNRIAMRSYWLFAKKREFERLNVVYSHKLV